MLGAMGMLMSSVSKQLENFAGAMNFVIFPMFFASSALYPLWRVREGSPWLYYVCELNPFTHAVELVDRNSTRLNSSHLGISYAVFCLKKKKNYDTNPS